MPSYPALQYFFSAYFHQDWRSEHADSNALVDTFRRNESDDQVRQVRRELRQLLDAGHTEQALEALLHGQLQSSWAPTTDGPEGYRQWLQGLHDQFSAGPEDSTGNVGNWQV